ncbi:hypothetical protein EV356DRAFT_499814 [Viridothelium virens]|uniref:N-acetyltransferase domain-containing protein n=1 Tax=Viridothelium virens TaxID=1048519 RepID=A0A6A6HNG2_VIRVR|nr:hypothetical protein EV356DRAFT_499814 [Viridothelium virens]
MSNPHDSADAPKEWGKTLDDGTRFRITARRNLLDEEFISNVFGSDELYWTERMKPSDLSIMLDNSVTLGLYTESDLTDRKSITEGEVYQQIGLARLVTDKTTFAYLTDVFIENRYRGLGLGRWLMTTVQETVDAMPHLRRMMLLTSGSADTSVEGTIGTKIRFYEETLGLSVFVGSRGLVSMSGRGNVGRKKREQLEKR